MRQASECLSGVYVLALSAAREGERLGQAAGGGRVAGPPGEGLQGGVSRIRRAAARRL